MSLTAHYISKDWQLEAKCLATSFVPENQTKDVLADALKVGAQEWGIEEEKISCITTDNGANIIAAVRELKWPWLNCFGHNVNVAINNALDGEKDRVAGVCAWKYTRSQAESLKHVLNALSHNKTGTC